MSVSPVRPELDADWIHIVGGDGDGDEGGDSGAGSGNSGDEGGGDSNNQGDNDSDDVQKRLRDLEAERDKFKKEKIAEKRRADAAERNLTDKERESQDADEQIAAEHAELKEKYDKLLKFVETGYLDTAILRESNQKNKDGQPRYDWHDVEAVRAFLDHENINIDMDTGAIDGLDMELKRIAKERPYLLVQKEERDGSGGSFTPPANSSGSHPFGGQARQRETDRKKLGVKYNLPGFRGPVNQANVKPM